MSLCARSPTLRSIPGERSSPSVSVITAMSAPAATPRRASSRRLGSLFGGALAPGMDPEAVPTGAEIAVIASCSSDARIRGRALGRAGGRGAVGERLRHGRAQEAAIGPALRLRGQPAHDLAHLAGARRAGARDRLLDERGDFGLGQLVWEVGGEDADLGLLLRCEVLAAALPERLDGLAPRLHLPRENARDLVVAV